VGQRLVAAALAAQAALAAPAFAAGADRISIQPAATLLLPYFEVALGKKPGAKQKGVNTVFSVNNAGATAVLARVTLWSDLGIPVAGFDLYLTGYDVQTVDLFEVLSGRLPATAPDGQDPEDTISPHGPVSQDISFPNCAGQLPPPASMGAEFAAHVQAALSGRPSPLLGNQCAGLDHGGKKPVARGFVTVDAVNQCSAVFANSAGYFLNGGTGIASNQNALWGEWFIADKKRLRGDALVHVRADALDADTNGVGDYTFYMRHVANTGADNRQPLATNFAGRFANDPKDRVFPGGSSIVAWRDPKVAGADPFDCGSPPSWFPLEQEQIVAFDEEENPEVPSPSGGLRPFPGATQTVRVGGPELPVEAPRGWIFLNLNGAVTGQAGSTSDPDAAQGFVTVVHETKGGAAALRANALDSAVGAAANHTPISVP
jgi:hypothetical protein